MNLLEQIYRISELTNYKKFVNEGRIVITPDEKEKLKDILGKTVVVINGSDIGPNEWEFIDQINYKYADGKDAIVSFYVSNDEENAYGYYNAKDRKKPEDNIIVIQQAPFKKMFTGKKKYHDYVGESNTIIDKLSSTISHEFLHAKDPNMNEYIDKIPYSSKDEKKYYGSWAEYRAMTGDFFDSLVSKIEKQ